MVGASVKLLLFQCCLACVQIKHSITHTAVYQSSTPPHTHWMACEQIQIKPYGSSLSSFTVCNPGAVEGQEQPTPVFTSHGRQEQGWCKEVHMRFSILSAEIPALLLPKATYTATQDEKMKEEYRRLNYKIKLNSTFYQYCSVLQMHYLKPIDLSWLYAFFSCLKGQNSTLRGQSLSKRVHNNSTSICLIYYPCMCVCPCVHACVSFLWEHDCGCFLSS